jgi:hypothetical protein
VWPNPTEHLLNVEVENHQLVHSLEIVDDKGQVVRRGEKLQGNRKTLDISELSSGVYFVRLTFDDKEPVNLKFVKQ